MVCMETSVLGCLLYSVWLYLYYLLLLTREWSHANTRDSGICEIVLNEGDVGALLLVKIDGERNVREHLFQINTVTLARHYQVSRASVHLRRSEAYLDVKMWIVKIGVATQVHHYDHVVCSHVSKDPLEIASVQFIVTIEIVCIINVDELNDLTVDFADVTTKVFKSVDKAVCRFHSARDTTCITVLARGIIFNNSYCD